MAVRSAVAFVAILSATVPLGAWARWDKKLDPAAVKVMCQSSEDAVSAERRAERDFEDAAAASAWGGWDQSLTMVSVAERARWRRLSADLIAASRKRTDTTEMALDAASDLSEMRAAAVHLNDEASIITLDKCRRRNAMNWDQIEGKWKELKGGVREKWGKLTDDELTTIGGKRDRLAGVLQQKYGIAKEEAEAQITAFEKSLDRTLSAQGES